MKTENKKELNDTCLYMHTRKSDGRIFYIGIGCKKRSKSKSRRNKYWHNIVNKYDYDVTILVDGLTWSRACELEVMMIAFYGRKNKVNGCLVNATDGGEGSKGKKVSDETKEKISQKKKGNIPWNTGIKCSDETKEKMRKKLIGLMSGEKNAFYGKKHTEETKKIMSEMRKGTKASEETKEKLSKIVMDINTGVFYSSAKEAADVYGVKYITLSAWLRGQNKNKTSLRYV